MKVTVIKGNGRTLTLVMVEEVEVLEDVVMEDGEEVVGGKGEDVVKVDEEAVAGEAEEGKDEVEEEEEIKLRLFLALRFYLIGSGRD